MRPLAQDCTSSSDEAVAALWPFLFGAAKGRPSPWEERPRCSANPLSPPLSVQENSGGPLASPRMGSERNRHSETLLAFATTPMAARRHEYPEQLRWLGRRCPSSPALARISRGSSRR